MQIKLDIWYRNPTKLTHEELSEDQIIEALTMYLKSIERIREEDKVTIEIDEIITR